MRLLVAHPEPRLEGGWWVCRRAARRPASTADGSGSTRRRLSTDADPVDIVRAACAAAWDAPTPGPGPSIPRPSRFAVGDH